MKKVLIAAFAICLIACDDKKKENTENNETSVETTVENDVTTETSEENASEEEEKLPILTGVQTRKAIAAAPYDSWYEPTYDTYKVDTQTIAKIKPLLNDVEVKLFMGTWCEDSQREVPQFFKIWDALDANDQKITLITVDEDKMTPRNLEAGLDITNVPTFIFYKDGEELNRIVEFPVETLEKDMLSILSGASYKHSYAE